MAPTRPKSKTAISAAKKPSSTKTEDSFDSGFHSSKKDKRMIKHSAFVSKIEKSRKKPLKRRRPPRKLVANLNSLADALPDAGDETLTNSQVNIIKHKSLKHKPGAMKRKERLDKIERERFAKNMAQMVTGLEAATPASSAADAQTTRQASSSNRWAALRGFISQTIDQNPEFKR
ncbi:hypothetical protein PRK78_006874 [Emydomyces testavorans]|uniref:Ribosome biogenesis protein SLX9 n=1 Tax=Emydomyces testavorans TaxID=2070801 RepID=A0AAF0DN75_9EURO|nr:hypothetical protein PRK78_006874 [Emydomyces testavorans]